MVYEIYKQLQEKAEKRQLNNPRIWLTHNLGGFPFMCVIIVITIYFRYYITQ